MIKIVHDNLTLNIIRYVSRVKDSDSEKGVAPSPTSLCCNLLIVILQAGFCSPFNGATFFTYLFVRTHSFTHRPMTPTSVDLIYKTQLG